MSLPNPSENCNRYFVGLGYCRSCQPKDHADPKRNCANCTKTRTFKPKRPVKTNGEQTT